MSIALRITWCGVQIPDVELRAEIPESDVVKLRAVISYNGLRDSKAANDVLPYEFGDIFVLDASICFCFYPFTEVICGDEQEFLLGAATGRGPTMSIPHCAKGQGLEIDFNVSDGTCGMRACLWNLSHFLT